MVKLRGGAAHPRPLHPGTADFPRDRPVPPLVPRVRGLEEAGGGLSVPSPELAVLHSELAYVPWKWGAQLKSDLKYQISLIQKF